MVTSMLEKAIEIEGLLRIIRDGNPLPETYTLLNIKTGELAEDVRRLEDRIPSSEAEAPIETVPTVERADFVMTTAEEDPQLSRVVFTEEAAAHSDKTADSSISVSTSNTDEFPDLDELELAEDDDIILSFEETQDSTPSEPSSAESGLEPIEISTSATDEHPSGISETFSTESQSPEACSGSNEEQPKPKDAHAKTNFPKTAVQRQGKLKSAFSLNDRFLFSRELFDGNMKMFDSTLEFIEGIEDYTVIEEYFYNELEWDPDDSNVTAFLEILKPQFAVKS